MERNPEIVGNIVEKGILELDEDSKVFVPYEHIAYANKGVAAITLTVRETPYESRT